MSNKILVVDSDNMLLNSLQNSLLKENYIVLTAVDGSQALEKVRMQEPDIIVMEIMLPKLNGLEVCRILRKETIVPILILSAVNDEIEKVIALELGADDYVTKPFNERELLARIRAMLRRKEIAEKEEHSRQKTIPQLIEIDNLTIDVCGHRVSRGGKLIKLTPIEFKLLVYLSIKKGHVFSRKQILAHIWGYDCTDSTRMLDFHIRSLRQKIENDPNNPVHIVTVRGVGFKFES